MRSPADAAPSYLLVEGLTDVGGRVALGDEERHYVARVCRARPGDRFTATDGRGALAGVRLVALGREAVVEIESCRRPPRAREAWLLAGPPEGERGDWLVEKLAELGVATLQPVDCGRGAWEPLERRADRWRRLAVAGLRQSRRRHLLEVRPPLPLAAAIAALPAGTPRSVGSPEGPPAASQAPADGLSVGLIGPAAGLTPEEGALAAAAGFAPISLSDGRLRAETAAIAWACWWASGARDPDRPSSPGGGLDATPARP